MIWRVVGMTAYSVHEDRRYKWVALSNTTLGLLMATINSSIVLIAMPDIFRGIGIDPLAPGNTGYGTRSRPAPRLGGGVARESVQIGPRV